MDRLRALPGVRVRWARRKHSAQRGNGDARFRNGRNAASQPDAGTILHYTFAAGDYFKAMGIDVMRGRPFDRNDHDAQSAKRRHQPSRRRICCGPGRIPSAGACSGRASTTWETVVGVVDDVMQDDFRDKPRSARLFPARRSEADELVHLVAGVCREDARAETIAPEIRALAREVAPSAPMYRVYTMAGLAKDSMVQLSFTMLTLGIASALALILGAVGLYGVLSYVVAQRTREIGVRMALGAEAGGCGGWWWRRARASLAVGVAIGVGVALASTRALGSLLFGVKAVDVPTFVGMSVSMVLIGLLASYVPARRASRVDPDRVAARRLGRFPTVERNAVIVS